MSKLSETQTGDEDQGKSVLRSELNKPDEVLAMLDNMASMKSHFLSRGTHGDGQY